MRVVVVGGGILGTMHAWHAVEAGYDVVHIERDAAPRQASVRNFGLIWVSGRADGAELEAALRARHAWERIGERVPDIGFRPCGSTTVALDASEERVLKEVAASPTAPARGLELLDAEGVRRMNPAIAGDVIGGLACHRDAVVEPRRVLDALRLSLMSSGRYRFETGLQAVRAADATVVDQFGHSHSGDLAVICPGADHGGPAGAALAGLSLRRVFLHMMETEPTGYEVPTAIADGDSLRYYPGFRTPALADLRPQDPAARAYSMQLLMVQRPNGGLTIGDTHLYEEPFDFAVEETPYRLLRAKAEQVLGRELPATARRWHGVYSQALSDDLCVRIAIDQGTWVVTGPGGRGHTLAPAIAADTYGEALR